MLKRIAMLSAHTSPLEQPGDGDAGGMNVYVLELSRQLASRGIEVEIFTRATSRHQPQVIDAEPGIRVHHVAAGPFEGLQKNDLPSQLCSFVRDVLRAEVEREPGHFDLVHSHYWLSGQVGTVARERWDVPLVHTMHTMAKVKNAMLAEGDTAEPIGRVYGEEEIVRFADRLIANTVEERRELIEMYGAEPERVAVVHPGVDLEVFRSGRQAEARATLDLPEDAALLLFAGRIQPLKAPDVVLKAAARMLDDDPALRERLVVAIVGGASGSGLEQPSALTDLSVGFGIRDVVRFIPTVSQTGLADWYAAASVVCVPSYNESFGLVAIEAQACGTPVVAARVGGLSTAVSDGVTGVLVDGHDPADYASALHPLLTDPDLREAMSQKAVRHAESFGWDVTADRTLKVYEEAIESHREQRGTCMTEVRTTIVDALEASELEYTEHQTGTFEVTLPGERKLQTACRLEIGKHALGIHAFVCRNPDENHETVYRWLLERNLKMFGVAFAVDSTGDIYLDGRLPLHAVTADEIDRVLGAVLTYADESFNTILELGFASSIRKEWEWRESRGESTRNLDAFKHLKPVKATVFADVTDPWSYIGSTRFERAAAMFSILTGEPVEMTFRAHLLEPDAPSDGRLLMEVAADELGGRDQAELINAQVTAAAKITGIDLNFEEAVRASSFDSWRLLTWADEAGPGIQRDLAHQLWRAHFLEGADIGDPFTLATRAALVGLELETAEALLASTEYADEVRTQASTGDALGITQLPYVVIEQQWTLAGIHSQNDYVQALNQIHLEWKGAETDDE